MYQIEEKDGKTSLSLFKKLKLTENNKYELASLEKNCLVGSLYYPEENRITINSYSNGNMACIYFWLMKRVGILKEYKPAACRDIISRLI